jgi:hypothetical protein
VGAVWVKFELLLTPGQKNLHDKMIPVVFSCIAGVTRTVSDPAFLYVHLLLQVSRGEGMLQRGI